MIAQVCTCMRVAHIYRLAAATNLTSTIKQFERLHKQKTFNEEESIIWTRWKTALIFKQICLKKKTKA